MSRRTTWEGTPCPIARAADVLAEPWTLLILRNATAGTTRFEDFRTQLGIADNVLTTRLAKLVDRGLLTKLPYRDGGRTRHEYRLTKAGSDALPVLHALGAWGDAYTSAEDAAGPMQLVHVGCGELTRPGTFCDSCGKPLVRDDLAWRASRLREGTIPLAEPVG
ncbi:helix-turn-helix domain-containing protein [Amycolatopsis mongoliensis]|uniref:Helix-turn-helix domain-containing protein n=1 Tax=Amycolatopsis mongoliensis TaxID=715475 RepID=A0A9Y2NIP4_9PSEU|nr:helix-turn-helix domain-containing protein [Amycolatopsis sp. 4-36]WIY03149.1 helix-turn-helix domain-containing protein [Amycolatopsis sp. 4-36]